MGSGIVKGSDTVILAEIIQDFRNTAVACGFGEDGFDIILVITEQLCPEHHQFRIEKGGTIPGMKHIFNVEIFQGRKNPFIFTGMKDQKISFCFLIQHMGEKFRQSAVCGH